MSRHSLAGNPVGIMLLLLVQLFLSAPAFAQVTVIFSDGRTTDFKFYYEPWGLERKAELRRCDDDTVIASWGNIASSNDEENTKYISDFYVAPAGVSSVDYRMYYYEWDTAENDWSLPAVGDAMEVATGKIKGVLHNNAEWLSRLNRTAVSWSGVVHGEVENLTVEDGDLIVESGSVITMNGLLRIKSPATMYTAEEYPGLEHQAMFEGDGTIIFEGYDDPFHPLLRYYYLADEVRVDVLDCTKVSLVFNQLGSDDTNDIIYNQIYVYGNSSEVYLAGNRGGRITVNAGTSEILENDVAVLNAYGDGNTIEENRAAAMEVSGKDNTIRNNRITMQPVMQAGSPFNAGRGIFLYGGSESTGNLITNNTILCKYTVRHNQEAMYIDAAQNDIVKNVIGEADHTDYYGGGLLISGYGNNVRDNDIVGVRYFGIKLLYDADMNVIADNSIVDSSTGILIIEGNENHIYGNRISNNATAGISMELENYEYSNGIHDNHIYKNSISGGTDGIRMVHEGIEKNRIYQNIIEENSGYGIVIPWGNIENTIYGNRFSLNTLGHGIDDGNDNAWHTQDTGGNYWDDYIGTDLNQDGFGDTPYPVPGTAGESDLKPLMVDQGAISVSPMSVTYDTHVVSKLTPRPPAEKTVTVSNQGTMELSIFGIQLEGADSVHFELSNDPCAGQDIAPGGSCVTTVAYDPFSAGNHVAELVIISTDPARDVVRVTLSGEAVLPLPGDVNGNGIYDLADALIILQILAGMEPEPAVVTFGETDDGTQLMLSGALYILRQISAQ